MRIAIIQTDPVFGQTESNVHQAISLMASHQADCYVLPELFNTGYNFMSVEETHALSESIDGPTYRAIAAFARERSCHVVYGFAERSDQVYNSSALVGPKGLVGIYRKVHLFNLENLFFAPGNLGFPVFDIGMAKIGMMICFDWFFPESARSLALRGAHIIAHPANLVLPYCPDAMVTRCLENRVFAATANRIGTEDRGGTSFTYVGLSEVVSPRGEILTRMGSSESGARVIVIDPLAAQNKRINQFNDLLNDRKPAQYVTE